MEPEAISSMRAKVKWQKISIYKCEKLLPFDVKNFLPFGYPLAKIQQTAVFLSFGNVYLLAFVLITKGYPNAHWEELLQSVSDFIFSKHCGYRSRGLRGVK